MSSHFFPMPRSWIIKASSCGVHFDCFFAGDAGAFTSARFIDGLDDVGGRDISFSGMFGKAMVVLENAK